MVDHSCIAIQKDCELVLNAHREIEKTQNSIGEERKEASTRLAECKQTLDELKDNYKVEEALAEHRKLSQRISRAATFNTKEKKEEFMKDLKKLEELIEANEFEKKTEEEKEAEEEAKKRTVEQTTIESSLNNNNKSRLVAAPSTENTLPSMDSFVLPTAIPSAPTSLPPVPPTLPPAIPTTPTTSTPAIPTVSSTTLPLPPTLPTMALKKFSRSYKNDIITVNWP